MPSHAYRCHEAPFTGLNSQNIKRARRATQVLAQVLQQQDPETVARCFPWQRPPPKTSKKPLSAKSTAVIESFRDRQSSYQGEEPFSLPSWQDHYYRPQLIPNHHTKPPLQGLFHMRPSPASSTTCRAGYGPSVTSHPATHVSTPLVHGRPAHHHHSQHPQWVTNDQESQVVPEPGTERLAASAAKTRIHQILHHDGAKRASNGRGTARLTRAGGSSLKRQLSVNNGDAREELAWSAGNRTSGTDSTVSGPPKRARKRAGQ